MWSNVLLSEIFVLIWFDLVKGISLSDIPAFIELKKKMFGHSVFEHLHFLIKIDREISKRYFSINQINQTLITLLKHTDIRSDDRMSECINKN